MWALADEEKVHKHPSISGGTEKTKWQEKHSYQRKTWKVIQ